MTVPLQQHLHLSDVTLKTAQWRSDTAKTDHFDKEAARSSRQEARRTIKSLDPLYCAANLPFLMNLTPPRIKK